MTEFEELLKRHGVKNNLEDLKELINSISTDELCEYIKARICKVDSLTIWNYVLSGFTDSSSSHKKRYKVIKTVLERIKPGGITSNHEEEIIQRLGIELPKFKWKHLLHLVDFCLESIQSYETNNSLCWKDLLPQLLNVIITRDKIEYNDIEMSGLEYKKQVINSLCMLKWPINLVISLAAMFKNINLTKDEHLQIMNKLGKSMDALTPQEISAFTYQLLRLCKNQNGKAVILRLKDYFGKRLYSNIYKGEMSSDETVFDDLDAIESAANLETIQAESTVLYHIHQVAFLGHGSIKEYLSSLKIISKAPEYVIHPFQLFVLLSIACVQFYEETVLDIIKYSLSKSIIEEQKRDESTWFRDIVPSKINIKQIFDIILDSNLKERGIVVEGLIKLAFCLLATSNLLGREVIAEREWNLSYEILTRLIKKRRDVAPTILKQLRNKILTESSVIQYTECLYRLCRSNPLDMLENQNIVVQLIEQMVELSSASSILVVRSVLPLMKISHNIRDSLVLVLRKALYARDIGTRQMAVIGFLQLLENLKVYNLLALSQSECSSTNGSGRSVLSQLSVECRVQTTTRNVHSNEVLCLEVLNVLRRCFMLQSEVKIKLYDGLYDAICKNSELHAHGLEMLLSHFTQFFDENENPPLKISNIVLIKDNEAVLKEPLGKFIFVIGLIITKLKDDENINIRSLNILKENLNMLINKMARCDLASFGFEEGANLLDDLPENRKKQIELSEVLLIYEALMGYAVLIWNKNSDSGLQILHLFKVYSKLVDFAKNLGKKKKAIKRKKDDPPKKNIPNPKTQEFKFEQHVVNLHVIEKFLTLLYAENVEWATKVQMNHLKVSREFHRFVFTVLLEILPTITAAKVECDHASHYYHNCKKIAHVIYTRCLKRLNDLADFDRQVASNSIEVFYSILNIICTHYKKKLSDFLGETDEKSSKEKTLSEQIFPLIETFEELLETEDWEANEEEGIKRNGEIILKIISLLISQLPPSSPHNTQVLDWLKKFCNEHTECNRNTTTSLINLMFSLQLRCKSILVSRTTRVGSLYEDVAAQVCKIIGSVNKESVEAEDTVKLINESTSTIALQSLCKILQIQLDNVDWVVHRLRADYSMIMYPGELGLERKREKLKSNESDLCSYVCCLIEIAITLSSIAVTPGPISENIFKVLTHLYNSLGSLTKYFILRSTKDCPIFQNARFEKIVQLTGKYLSTNVYGLILFIEESQQPPEEETTQAKRRKVDSNQLKTKVLRDTRFIPKLVYEIEQFGKFIIQLSNKTKIDLKKYIKQGTSRDFRIKAPILKEALENLPVQDITVDDEESVTTMADEESVTTVAEEESENHEKSGEQNRSSSGTNRGSDTENDDDITF